MTAPIAKLGILFAFFAVVATPSATLLAQPPGGGGFGGPFGGGFGSAVGGVLIDASGAISQNRIDIDRDQARQIEAAFKAFQGEAKIDQAAQFRVLSLKGLEQALSEARANNQTISQELAYMAGLQRIEYVVVSPDKNDIWIAGPAEPWRLNEQGVVVGVKSGTPVIQLQDFLAAMRSSEASRTGQGISVSIDPTEEGVRQLQQFFKNIRSRQLSFQPAMQADVERAMGQHLISLTGVPQDSRFAQVLVAADYSMKRLSMGFDQAPIEGLPSVMEMAVSKNAKFTGTSPRFWMECNYQPIARDEASSIFKLQGQGVKTLTEESRFDNQGRRSTVGKENPFAAKWAALMTEKFEQLSAAQPIFRELRNIMDMSVVAALIAREGLLEKASLELPVILGKTDGTELPKWNVPKTVPTHCGFVRIANPADPSWIVSASGGVQLDPWGVAQQTEIQADLGGLIELAQASATTRENNRWWWDAAIN